MFDAARNDYKFPWRQLDRAIAKLHPHPSAPDEKQFIFMLVMMPEEFTLNFTTFTSRPFNSPTIFGRQCSEKDANFSARLTFLIALNNSSPIARVLQCGSGLSAATLLRSPGPRQRQGEGLFRSKPRVPVEIMSRRKKDAPPTPRHGLHRPGLPR